MNWPALHPASLLKALLPTLLVSAAMMIACYLATGPTLGLFFGGIVVATLVVPPMTIAQLEQLESPTLFRAGHFAIAFTVVGLSWLLAFAARTIRFDQWVRDVALLMAWCFALAGLSAGLRRVLKSPVPASALCVTLALAWIAWPIWLAPHLAGATGESVVARFAPAHPWLVLNGVMPQLGMWSERPIAYAQLLNLGQDIAYELPKNVWPASLIYIALGAVGFIFGSAQKKTMHQ